MMRRFSAVVFPVSASAERQPTRRLLSTSASSAHHGHRPHHVPPELPGLSSMRAVADAFPNIPFSVRDLLHQFDEQQRLRCPHPLGSPGRGFEAMVDELPTANPLGVFSNSELNLGEIRWIGFDFDFSLAHYTNRLLELIYNLAKESLVGRLKYPTVLRSFKYDHLFSVRGLSFDTRTGLLCKLSNLSMVSLAYRGRTQLSSQEILNAYDGCVHISREYNAEHMRPMLDQFCLSEMGLLSDIIQYFQEHDVPYDSLSVYEDVHNTVASIHQERVLHRIVMDDLPAYITPSPELENLLNRMRFNKCRLFLLSNSPYDYVNAGLTYLIGRHWFELFDIIVCNAAKPSFFTSARPFRRLCMETGRVTFETVKHIERGTIYLNGSFSELSRLTKSHAAGANGSGVVSMAVHEPSWNGRSILYIGDNLQSDLVDPRRAHGWTTAAIIRELEDEIQIQNSVPYRLSLVRLLALEELMRRIQITEPTFIRNDVQSILEHIEKERVELRRSMSQMLHRNFGSVFRSGNYPTMLAFSLYRFVDLYTSRLENLLKYAVNHRWLPHRRTLPHEPRPFDADIHFVFRNGRKEL